MVASILAGLGTAACGAPDVGVGEAMPVKLDPEKFWTGQRAGYREIQDRNGNVIDTAFVRRVCTISSEGGRCEDSIRYASGSEESLVYRVFRGFDEEGRTLVTIEESGRKEKGKVYGGLIELSGLARIPKASIVTKSSTRLHAMNGPMEPVMEVRSFTYFGILSGLVTTLWLRSAGDHVDQVR
ncbi:MAG: hypothetical protein HY042_12895 [Spirochaetia bacterium]|nr:hypothetical protein [Spirochaetia bacterium]